jgi:hypothetical protein
MSTSKPQVRTAYCCVLVFLTSVVASCNGSGESEHHGTTGGGSSGKGGSSIGSVFSGGSGGGSSGKGGSSAGSVSTSGTGGGSAGGTGGCFDVCGLYGAPCCGWSEGCIEPGGSCVIDVLSARVDVIYDYASLEQKIASIPPDVLASFTDADIASVAAEPPAASRIEMHMTPEASSRYGTVLENALLHPFRFSCGGQSLFVGVIYDMIGAAGIRTPVLHVARDAENPLVLRLGAWQGAWMGMATMEDPGARKRIDRPELRAVFCLRGALRELSSDVLPSGS